MARDTLKQLNFHPRQVGDGGDVIFFEVAGVRKLKIRQGITLLRPGVNIFLVGLYTTRFELSITAETNY